MTEPRPRDIVLRDIDPVLSERIARIADAHGWNPQEALMHLLEHGLFACESALAGQFSHSDAEALKSAIAALEQVPDDVGFALIGKPAALAASPATVPRGPDQAIAPRLFKD